MKQRGFSSKWARRFAVVAVILLGVSLSSQAFPFLKKKKKTVPVVKKDAYERALSDNKTDSAKGPFISLYKTGGKLLVELPPSSLGRDMLVGATGLVRVEPTVCGIGLAERLAGAHPLRPERQFHRDAGRQQRDDGRPSRA